MTVDSLIVLSFTLSRCCRSIFHLVVDSQHGEVQCRPVECPELPCKHPVNITGQCCQSCLSKGDPGECRCATLTVVLSHRTLSLLRGLLRPRGASDHQEVRRVRVSRRQHAVHEDRPGDDVSQAHLSSRRAVQRRRQLLQVLSRYCASGNQLGSSHVDS
jgi:hypothetical protein